MSSIRKKLITYLADADEKKVKAIYALFEDQINNSASFELSEDHLNLLQERKEKYLTGKSKAVDWKEAHKSIRNKRK